MSKVVNYESYKSHYSDSKMWGKIVKVAKKAGVKVIYMVLLLNYVMQSPHVSTADKAKICGALGYFILPLDIVPDAIPALGFTDDLAALAWALHAVWDNITPEMKLRAKSRLHEWFGNFDERELDTLW